jgi:hypothetical protein
MPEGLGKLVNFNYPIGSRTRGFQDLFHSALTTTLLRASKIIQLLKSLQIFYGTDPNAQPDKSCL